MGYLALAACPAANQLHNGIQWSGAASLVSITPTFADLSCGPYGNSIILRWLAFGPACTCKHLDCSVATLFTCLSNIFGGKTKIMEWQKVVKSDKRFSIDRILASRLVLMWPMVSERLDSAGLIQRSLYSDKDTGTWICTSFVASVMFVCYESG